MTSISKFLKSLFLILCFNLSLIYAQSPNDVGVNDINATGVVCSPNQPIEVILQNYGSNQLDSVIINWSFNSVLQTPVNNKLLIDTVGGAFPDVITVPLGTVNLNNGIDTILIWTTLPNGMVDPITGNDTIRILKGLGMSGTYTIDSPGDFESFTEAVFNLTLRGVCGPVTILPAAGTYNDSIILTQIDSVNATRTITFDGMTAGNVIMTSSRNATPTIAFDGADYVTIQNMTIAHTGTADVWGVHFMNASDHNTIDNCTFNLPIATTTDMIAIIASNSYTSETSEGNNANYLTISNNTIVGGETGIHLEGAATENVGNRILNNTISFCDDHGIQMDEQDSITIVGNTIHDLQNTQADGVTCNDITFATITHNDLNVPDIGFDLHDMSNFNFSYNKVIAIDLGVDVDDANDGTPPSSNSLVSNNMIHATDEAGMSWDDAEHINVYHNSVYGNPAIHFNDNNEMELINNIFVADDDYAFEDDDGTVGEWNVIENNIYFNNSTNLIEFGPDYATLAAWQAGVGAFPQAGSIEGKPIFYSATDLHILAGIPSDAGLNIATITDDIDGDTRPFAPSTTVDIGADEFLQVADDAGVTALSSIPCPGATDLYVTITNYGDNPLTSVTINWDLDDGIAPPIVGSQAIVGLNVATGSDTVVNAGSINFTGPSYDMTLFTTLPNGVADGQNSNDTTHANDVQLGLSGNYTIGATGDFPDFIDAVQELISRGVCSPVVITADAGTYNNAVEIPEIMGASATNTITFTGVNSSTVIWTSSNNATPTIALNGADHFIFSNMSINHTGTTDAWGIHLRNGADHNTIDECIFNMPIGTGTDIIAIVASASLTAETTEGNNANHLTISNNTIIGGETGIYLEGAAVENVGNSILNNDISFCDDRGIGGDEQDSIRIDGNVISDLQNIGADGVFMTDLTVATITNNNVDAPDNGFDLNDLNDFEFSYNQVIAGDMGVDVDDANDLVTPATSSIVYNNMIKSGNQAGMSWDDAENIDFYHNNIYGNPALHFDDNDNMNLLNNILVADADFALEIVDATTTEWNDIDNNIYFNDGLTDLLQFGTAYADLVAWQAAVTAFPQAASFEGDPNFYSATDLHVKGGLASDAGVNIAFITDDVDGDIRPFAPSITVDIGADEFLQVADDAGVILGELPMSWFIGCDGYRYQLRRQCADKRNDRLEF